jgi:hypothetical protein
MKTSRLIIFALIVGLPVSGCSGTIFKQFSIDNSPATSISLDARQRLIFVTEKGGPVPEKDGVPVQQHRIICAEPSPDAFMALVAAGGADLTMGKKEIGAYGSMAESVGALGRRTQTVQLLRDVLYRACEAYMNGVIDKNEYRRIMVAYDELVITLAAIESLGRSIAEPFPPPWWEERHRSMRPKARRHPIARQVPAPHRVINPALKLPLPSVLRHRRA